MKRIVFLLCLLAIFPIFIGCTYTLDNEDYVIRDTPSGKCYQRVAEHLETVGLFGEHKLHRLTTKTVSEGSLRGSFFLVYGTVAGQMTESTQLQFAWEGPRSVYISTLPLERVAFVLDEDKTEPTVQFRVSLAGVTSCFSSDTFRASHNLNLYITAKSIDLATVRLTRETFEREVLFKDSPDNS